MKSFPYSQHPAFLPIVTYLLALLFWVVLYFCVREYNFLNWNPTPDLKSGVFSIWFKHIAIILAIPTLGLFTYYKSKESRIAKFLFIVLSILLFFPWALSPISHILIGASNYKSLLLSIALIAIPFLLADFLKKESIGNFFLLACCLSAYLAPEISIFPLTFGNWP